MDTIFMSQNLDGETWNSPYNDTDLGASKWFINYRDSLMVPSTASIFFGFSVIQYVVLVILLILRRNVQPVKSRNAVLLLLSLSGVTLSIMDISGRYMVGWWKYPCFLYALVYSILVPFIFLPGVVRAWRLLYVYKLNSIKKLFSGSRKDGNGAVAMSELRCKLPEKAAPPSRKFAIWKFWVSSKFIAIVFVVAFFIHICFFIINAFASGTPRLLISFKESCEIDNTVAYITIGQAFVYIITNLILIIFMYITKVKDTWSIRTEALFVLLQWIFFSIIFAAFAAFYYDFYIKGERYWPYGYFLLLGCFIDLFCTCWIPIIRSFLTTRRDSDDKENAQAQNGDSELLHDVLKNEDFRALFRKYCERSFCPEMVLFWEDVQDFMKLKTDAERRVVAKNIISRYLEVSCPLELNLPNREIFIPSIMQVLDSYEAELVQNSIPVGSNLLAEMGANIVAQVFDEEDGAVYKQAFVDQLSRTLLTQEQMLAATADNPSTIVRKNSFYVDEITDTHADEDSSTQTDQTTDYQTNTEGKKRHSKSFRLLKKLQKKKKKKQEPVQQLIPSNLFHDLMLHDENDMLDIFARFKSTKEFKKFMEELKNQEKLELIVS